MPRGGARRGAGRPKLGQDRRKHVVGEALGVKPKPKPRQGDPAQIGVKLPTMPSAGPDAEILDAFLRLNDIARTCLAMAAREQRKILDEEQVAKKEERPARIAGASELMGKWLERASRTLSRMTPYQRAPYASLPPPRPGDWDLSKLEAGELDVLERMAAKAQGIVIEHEEAPHVAVAGKSQSRPAGASGNGSRGVR